MLVLDDGTGHQGFVPDLLPDPVGATDGQVPTVATDAYVLTAPAKGFYAQDTDPGAVGAGSVWKQTGVNPELFWRRNDADDAWIAEFAPYVVATTGDADASSAAVGIAGSARVNAQATVVAEGNAEAKTLAENTGGGGADASVRATATDGGSADANLSAQSPGGSASATTTATGDGGTVARSAIAVDGLAVATTIATASGVGWASVEATSTTTTGTATAGSLASSAMGTAGMSVVADETSARLAFNGTTPIPVPELPAIPTPQDIADALVALGLVTQAA